VDLGLTHKACLEINWDCFTSLVAISLISECSSITMSNLFRFVNRFGLRPALNEWIIKRPINKRIQMLLQLAFIILFRLTLSLESLRNSKFIYYYYTVMMWWVTNEWRANDVYTIQQLCTTSILTLRATKNSPVEPENSNLQDCHVYSLIQSKCRLRFDYSTNLKSY
jgi:hypothetical protein